jgi:hydroxymethylpyrimidine pyrophosphatase-like HAD family hydrolase
LAAAAIELVVTDLDGTLWDAGEVVHDRTLAALRTLAEREVPVLVATGRRLGSAVSTLARSGLSLPTVVLDGALGRDVGAHRTFHRAAFTADRAAGVIRALTAAGLSPCAYVDRPDSEVVVGPSPSTNPRHLQGVGPALDRVEDLLPVADSQAILMFSVVGRDDPVLLRRAAAAVGDLAAPVVTRDPFYGGYTLTVRPPGISKWDGVLAWCREQGLDHGRVLAIGDGENDLELLAAARVACVVADGCDAALAVAHHVIEPAGAGGWSAVLDHV